MIQPLHERILALPFPTEEVSAGGIIVPATARERPSKATVVSVGNGLKDRPMHLKPGDVIFHVKGAGSEIEENGIKYYLMIDRDVLCTLKTE